MIQLTASRGAIVAAAGVAALWLVSPAAGPVASEGFGASMASIALHLVRDRLIDFDPGHPFDMEYFALSRLGANLLLALLVGPFGAPAQLALKLMMWLGLGLLAASSLVLVRRWAGVGWSLAAAALLVLPGPLETAFFYNDNLLSAGLATTALALLSRRRGWGSTLAAGAVFGLAVLTRVDAVLLAPAAALMVWGQERAPARFLLRGLAMAAAAAVPVLVPLAILHVTPLDLFRVTQDAVVLWGRGTSLPEQLRSTVLFLGPAGLVLAGIGVARLGKARAWSPLMLLLGVPLLYSLLLLGKLWQPRQLVLLTPFLAALAAVGLQRLLTPDGPGPLRRILAVAVIGAALLAPPMVWAMTDGPHALFGRFWTPVQWLSWQAATRRDAARVDAFVVALPPAGASLIVTDTWNDERYLHLALQARGFRPQPLAGPDKGCAPLGEVMTRGPVRVVHVRPLTPMVPDWRPRAVERWDAHMPACLAVAGAPALFLVAPVDVVASLTGSPAPASRWDAEARADLSGDDWVRIGMPDPRVMVRLTPDQFARLREALGAASSRWLAAHGGEAAWKATAQPTDDLMRARTGLGR